MKTLLLVLTSILFLQDFAMAQTVVFQNNSPSYYFIASFHSNLSGPTCPSASASTFHYDVPNNGRLTQIINKPIMDDAGNSITDVADITGLSLQVHPSGTPTIIIPFCSGGSYSSSGSMSFGILPGPILPFTTITWYVDASAQKIIIAIN
jgi:hypothetical protein